MKNSHEKTERTHPSFSTEWKDGDGRSGVYTNAEGLLWWYRPDGPGGHFGEVGSEQSYEDFLIGGPQVSGVPATILDQLLSALDAHGRISKSAVPEQQTAQAIVKKKEKTESKSKQEIKKIKAHIRGAEKKAPQTDDSNSE